MSKKGRTSIVLLGSLVLALICAPLVFLAYGAKLDRDALNNRIADLEATEVASPTALQADYRSVVEGYLQILPPDSDFRCSTSRDIIVFDPAHFAGWLEALEPAELDGVTVYPVTVAEDPETRYTIFYNASDEPVATLAPEQGYNPFAWLELLYPEYYAQNADPADLAWAEAQYDPARMSVTYYLLSVDDVEAMAEAQLAANAQRGFEMSMMMGEELPEPVTNVVIFAIETVSNGIALGIGWPEGFTNHLEVLARDTVGKVGWFVISTNLSTAGTNSLWWVDTTVDSNSTLRFYLVGDAQTDSDSDGLTDAREIRCYGTSITNCDSDADGLQDVEEIQDYFTDPLVPDTDQDGLTDGEEVRGSAAWAVSITNTMQWVEPGTNIQWVTQWATGQFNNGLASLALSEPISANISLGTNQFSSLRVSSDGYILLGETVPWDIVTYGVNLPLKWPGLTNLVAVFWDELNVSSNAGIWVETNGTGSESRVTITWLNARLPGPQGSEGCDFQMSYTASNSAYAFQYRESSGLLFPTQTLCTVGIRGDDSNRMARVFFNRYGVLHPNMSISLTPACSDPNNTNSDSEFGLDSEDAAKGMHPALQDDWGSDADGDGLSLWGEMEYGADAFDVDSDGDGMWDGEEVACYLNPASPLDFWWDADQDGLCNGDEFRYGADPLQVDTDNDGVLDLAEVNQATDPADPGSYESVDGAYGIILNMTGAAGKSVGGTCFQVGSYRVRAGEGIALPYAQRTEVKLMTMEGYVQCPRVNTDAWNGYYQYTLPSGDWFMGDVLVERPWNVFGENKVIPVSGDEISIFGGLKAKITAPGGGELQKNWCIGSTVEMQGAINLEGAAGGTWTWSVNDNTNDPSLTANGSNATLAIGGQVTVKASYKLPGYPVEASEILTVHENTVTFTLAPFIGVNDNDSDANGTNDCEQAQPPADDPEITTATVSYNKTCGCSQIIRPVLTLSCLQGADKIRLWEMDGEPYQYAAHVSNSSFSSLFKVEGTNASAAVNDVKFLAQVQDQNYPGVVVSNMAAMTVVAVDTVEASCIKANNTPQIFQGNKTDFGDPCATTNHGQALIIYHKDARDSDFIIQDFDILLDANIVPAEITSNQLNEMWVTTEGPDSGTLNRTDSFEVKLQNPQKGGIYKVEFGLGFNGRTNSGVNILLPLGGPDVTDYFLFESQRYDNWLTTMRTRVQSVSSDSFVRGMLVIEYFSGTILSMNHKEQVFETAASPCKRFCNDTVTIEDYVFGKDHVGNFLFSYMAARTGFTFGSTKLGAAMAARFFAKVPDNPDDQAAYTAGFSFGQNPSEDFKSILENNDIEAMQIETAKRGWPSTNVFTGATYPTFGALHSGGLPD